jgi:Mlc titration factor MtfA (ptsG expression regulator)
MTGLWVFLGGVALVVALTVWHASKVSRRRRQLRASGLSDAERALVEKRFPLWKTVPEPTRRLAEGWMRVFLDEKGFEACGGLEEVTDEMMLAVAAPACLLIAHRPQDFYSRLRSILIYPDAFHSGGRDVRLGESWSTGSVVLSWQSVCQGSADPRDGLNVVLHEFAHQIDQEDGVADGIPEFDEGPDYGRWSAAMAPAYERFCERVEAGKRSVLDDYGAESPAEFFAVGTETFFEKPRQLRDDEPEVYREFARFYGMDPAEWR